jgi:hypothetical protein
METIEVLKETVKQLDGKLKRSDKAFHASVVLLACDVNKMRDAEHIAKFTGYKREEVELFLSNLNRGGLGWKRKRFHRSGPWNTRKRGVGVVNFWMDVNMALGHVYRVFGGGA